MKLLENTYRQLLQIGFNPLVSYRFLVWFPKVIKDYIRFKKINDNSIFPIRNRFFITNDLAEQWGVASGHYFHQDLLVARKIHENNPERHVDIWSRIDGFGAHVGSFREIEIFDIRPLENKVSWLIFRQADLMNLDEKYIDYTDSISSLHAIEHFWLGRYWDPIDTDWHIKWLENIYKILRKWWKFYFSVPIWPQRIEFNAHRVFSVGYLITLFRDKYEILGFNYVDDKWDLHEKVDLTEDDIKNSYWCYYGCGIFELRKI